MARNSIEPHARLIAALAETMTDATWVNEIFTRCAQMKEAINEIERIAATRRGGER